MSRTSGWSGWRQTHVNAERKGGEGGEKKKKGIPHGYCVGWGRIKNPDTSEWEIKKQRREKKKKALHMCAAAVAMFFLPCLLKPHASINACSVCLPCHAATDSSDEPPSLSFYLSVFLGSSYLVTLAATLISISIFLSEAKKKYRVAPLRPQRLGVWPWVSSFAHSRGGAGWTLGSNALGPRSNPFCSISKKISCVRALAGTAAADSTG